MSKKVLHLAKGLKTACEKEVNLQTWVTLDPQQVTCRMCKGIMKRYQRR